jgi:hypothetical protein
VSAITALRQQIAGAIETYHFDVVVHERRAPSPFSSVTRCRCRRWSTRSARPCPRWSRHLNEPWSYAMVLGVEPPCQRIALVAVRGQRADEPCWAISRSASRCNRARISLGDKSRL